MSRHSRHSNDRSFHTAKERADAGYAFTQKEILGTDAFLPFGYCGVSLKPPKDPVVTPEGHIYDREFILEALLRQKMDLQAEQKKYEQQEKKKALKAQAGKTEANLRELEDFRKADQALFSVDYSHKRALDRSKEAVERELALDDRPEKRLRKGELLNVDKEAHREKAFWAKENTQTAPAAELKKVDTATRCPISGKKLKVKDLKPIKLELTDQKMYDKGGERGMYCCAVSKHPISYQQAVVLKPSGVVVLESVLKDCVYKDMRCPITGEPVRGKGDVLKLQRGNTGFASHNQVEAKVFNAIRSRLGDDRTQQGHLPKAGYVGLK